jgi:hypothetical protein
MQTILFVEDDPSVVSSYQMVAQVLAEVVRPIFATTIEEALTAIALWPKIDGMVLDGNLLEKSTIPVAKAFVARFPSAWILSASGEADFSRKLENEGVKILCHYVKGSSSFLEKFESILGPTPA